MILILGIIYGDVNECNIIMKEILGQKVVFGELCVYDVSVFIDFNDVVLLYIVFDVVICIVYMLIKCKEFDQCDVGGYVLVGYLFVCSMNDIEREVLKVCVCVRFVQNFVMGVYINYMNFSYVYVFNIVVWGWLFLLMMWEIL